MAAIFKAIALKLLTEKAITKLVLVGAEYLVSRTGNKLDDEVYKVIQEAIKS